MNTTPWKTNYSVIEGLKLLLYLFMGDFVYLFIYLLLFFENGRYCYRANQNSLLNLVVKATYLNILLFFIDSQLTQFGLDILL